MLPMRLFRSRGFAAGNLATFMMFGALFSAVFFMAQFPADDPLRGSRRWGPVWRLIPWTGPCHRRADRGRAGRQDRRAPLDSGRLVMQAVGFAWVALLAKAGLVYSTMIAPLVIAGIGISLAIPAAQRVVMNAVAPSQLGKASGAFSAMRQLGGAFGLAVAVAVFTGRAATRHPSPSALVRAGCRGLGLAVGHRRDRGHCPSAPGESERGGMLEGAAS